MTLAWHVDYFNRPWADPFSDAKYSERQMAYHELFQKSRPEFMKKAENGLYFTPMLMIDGIQPMLATNKSDTVRKLKTVIDQRRKTTSLVQFQGALKNEVLEIDLRSSKALMNQSLKSRGRKILVACITVQKTAETKVESGENENRLLKERSIVRNLDYFEWSVQQNREKTSHKFNLHLPEGLTKSDVDYVVFAQDAQTGEILQSFRFQA